MNSPAAEGFVLRSFHMQIVAGRKTFVTGYNVQPSSFVSLLLCQTLQEGSFFLFCLFFPLMFWPRYGANSWGSEKNRTRAWAKM